MFFDAMTSRRYNIFVIVFTRKGNRKKTKKYSQKSKGVAIGDGFNCTCAWN